MSLKGDRDRTAKLKQLQPGQTVRGVVARVVEYGVFVRLQHLDVTGLAHRSELSDSVKRDAAEALKVGQGGASVPGYADPSLRCPHLLSHMAPGPQNTWDPVPVRLSRSRKARLNPMMTLSLTPSSSVQAVHA